jgi:hypothetical protein
MACQWCGETHGPDRLCARAQRGMTRRSFCFLFGAGIAAAVLAPASLSLSEGPIFDLDAYVNTYGRYIIVTQELLDDAAIDLPRFVAKSYDWRQHTIAGVLEGGR